MTETLIIKDYTNEILEFKTTSISIIYIKNLVIILTIISALNEPLNSAYTR
jgi:hypothetical protein